MSVLLNTTNRAPVAGGDSYQTAEDTPLTVASPGVLANDADPDGDTLAAALAAGPAHGNVTLNSDGSFTYTPTGNYSGADSFTYRANDGVADSGDATVSLTVTAVNDVPSVTVTAGRSCAANDNGGTFDLAVADVDSPLGSLVLSATSSNTSVVGVAATTFGGSGASRTVTIAAGASSGSATVTVRVSDGTTSTTASISVRAGGNGKDQFTGAGGADLLLGRNGDDTLTGADGADVLCGGAGDDRLDGGDGSDALGGAAGNDRLTGGAAADRFSGGSGTDVATDLSGPAGDTHDGTIP